MYAYGTAALKAPIIMLCVGLLCLQVELEEGGVELKEEDVVPNTPSLITFSSRGYIKRMPVSTWDVQRRGGKGVCVYAC